MNHLFKTYRKEASAETRCTDCGYPMLPPEEDDGLGCPGPKPTFDVYRSEVDGAWVVHVDTAGMHCNTAGPTPLRVYINDAEEADYANPDYPEGGA